MIWVGLIWVEVYGGVIGVEGGMFWYVLEDFVYFKEIIFGVFVVMGCKIWDFLFEWFCFFVGCENIVVMWQQDWVVEGVCCVVMVVEVVWGLDWVWIIGGVEIFCQVIGDVDCLEVMEFDFDVDGDVYVFFKFGWCLIDEGEWQIFCFGVCYCFFGYEC